MASSRVFRASRALMEAAKAAMSSAAEATGKSPGILKSMPVSPAMKKFIGVPEISRAHLMKKIWEYIKLHNLQNPSNKKEIICDDDKLKTIFEGRDKVGMLEIAKFVSPHFLKSS